MAQHFLKSRAARDLTLEQLFNMREDQAYRWFFRARWPDGAVHCAHCRHPRAYHLTRNGRKQNRFKCARPACRREFTVTSGTPFAEHKMSFKKMLVCIFIFVQGVKGRAALELCRQVGLTYKAAWVFQMKLREALAAERDQMLLDGPVEIDGAYVGSPPQRENRAVDRGDRRMRENAGPADRQVVMALRQRPFLDQPECTLAVATPGELDVYVRDIVRRRVARTAVLISDEHPAYRNLGELNAHVTVNHQVNYAAGPGLNTNLSESFFSRLRRAELGIHHRVSGIYLDWYAAGLAWQENHRKESFRQRVEILLQQVIRRPQSVQLCGYWQGTHPENALGWNLPGPP